jgi:hypothetical protein
MVQVDPFFPFFLFFESHSVQYLVLRSYQSFFAGTAAGQGRQQSCARWASRMKKRVLIWRYPVLRLRQVDMLDLSVVGSTTGPPLLPLLHDTSFNKARLSFPIFC